MTNSPKAVEIIGGGLAGLALGIGLRRIDVPVTVFEAGDYPRHRVCGEFIAGLPETAPARLGIESVFEGSLRHGEVSWFLGDWPACRMLLPTEAIGISRFVLDARLAKLFVAHGGKLVTRHRVVGTIKGPGRVEAAGRRRYLDSPWVGLKAHVRNLSLETSLELHLGENAYVGLSQVEEGWVNVCGLFRRRGGLKWDSLAALAQTLLDSGLPRLAERVRGAELRRGSVCAVAGFAFDHRMEPGRGVVLGDTCAMVPPFTGNGMAMAFVGAALVLESLRDWALHHASWEETSLCVDAALRREFQTRLQGAALLHPLLLDSRGRACLGMLARTGLLPLRPLYHLLH